MSSGSLQTSSLRVMPNCSRRFGSRYFTPFKRVPGASSEQLAYDYFAEAALLDLADLHHNTCDGLHIASRPILRILTRETAPQPSGRAPKRRTPRKRVGSIDRRAA